MTPTVPPMVARAEALAREIGFPMERDGMGRATSCTEAVGRLLAMLAGSAHRIAELGSGAGYGTAWMASTMPDDASLLSVELDERRAAAVAQLFADDTRITVVHGDAHAVARERAPYDLVFVDCGGFDADGLRGLVDLVVVGGRIVVDDVTPLAALPPDSPFRDSDFKREAFFDHDRLASVEVVAPDLATSAVVGTRLR